MFHLDSLHLAIENLWKGKDRSRKTSTARGRSFWSIGNVRISGKMVKTKSLRALRLLPPNDSMPRANNGLVGANDSLATANDQTVRKRQRIFSAGRAKMRLALRNIPKEACRIAYFAMRMATFAIRITVIRSGYIVLLLPHPDKKIFRRAFGSADYNNLQYQ